MYFARKQHGWQIFRHVNEIAARPGEDPVQDPDVHREEPAGQQGRGDRRQNHKRRLRGQPHR